MKILYNLHLLTYQNAFLMLMFVRNFFKKITWDSHCAKVSSKKVLTSSADFLGISKNPQVSIKGTEDSKPNGSHHPVEYLIGAQLN